MSKFTLWLTLIGVIVLAAGGVYGWWWLDGRWRPKTIDRNQAEISALLQKSGWVSPGVQGGPKLYIIGYRSCPDCVAYWDKELPRLVKAGVDPRVILVARADANGQARSTPAERSTVAELWVNRRWDLFEQWRAVEPELWPAAGIIPADTDAARTAVVDQSRKVVEQLRPLLAANGLAVSEDGLRYPTLIWWTKAGEMRGCVCEDPRSWSRARKDLGA